MAKKEEIEKNEAEEPKKETAAPQAHADAHISQRFDWSKPYHRFVQAGKSAIMVQNGNQFNDANPPKLPRYVGKASIEILTKIGLKQSKG